MTAPKRIMQIWIIFALLIFSILMAMHPVETWHASVRGLSIWWDVLFPSLFPFLVLSELLLGFGIVHFLGTLLNPLMRPLFRVPGSGGFVFAVSCASGYPTGAKLTAQLWEQKLVTREEGERLVAFTTSSDPIFMIGAVSVGFFHNTSIAPILVASHYSAAFLVGVLMRFHGQSTAKLQPALSPSHEQHQNRFLRAIYAMHTARQADGRTFGELLRHAVSSSLRLIIIVGGLVVFFSVIMELLVQTGWLGILYAWTEQGLQLAGLPPSLSHSLVGGLFEVTLGAKEAGATASSIPLIFKVAAASFVLSWGGLSVHAQIMSVLSNTPMRYGPFLLARAIHAAIAPLLVILLWPVLMANASSPAFLNSPFSHSISSSHPGWSYIGATGILVCVSILFLLLCLALLSQLMLKRSNK
ncbi:Sporulation integral membrane protein YlbJ [Paenibacillus sp. JJ-100]|uniref:sporulation integral membrane protein YlbJ n=1 Tax=Paenibacillus sp. JJ-100 TaxID=2974896 RepID=UPI0022FF6351|nr:sporulation integral membrane protein YlbJ [Paenibacillus sp. JJ-100]CAI6083407.1 Sporulation integral membrane protein YlbJ [Paenibacillus sp. JJ-100]